MTQEKKPSTPKRVECRGNDMVHMIVDPGVMKKLVEKDGGKFLNKANTFEFIYAVLGLVVGVICVVGGLVLFFHGVVGSTSWTAHVLGAESKVSDAAPGAVFGILGFFVIYVTRYRIAVGRRR